MRRPTLAAAIALAACNVAETPNLTSTTGECEPGTYGCICEEESARCGAGLICSGGVCVSTEEESSSGGGERTTGESSTGDETGTEGESTGGDTTSTSTGGTDSSSGGEASATGSTGGSTTAPAPFCGDGIVDPGETCDDGNDIKGDGCDPDCTPNPYELDGFAEDVPLTALKGWSECYDSTNAKFTGWTWDKLKATCLASPGATRILLACVVEGQDDDSIASVVAAGAMPESWTSASAPPKQVGAAWWLFDGFNPQPQKDYYGAVNGPNPETAGLRVLLGWASWSEPNYLSGGPCGTPGVGSTRRLVYLRH